jgi:hypothetical protein
MQAKIRALKNYKKHFRNPFDIFADELMTINTNKSRLKVFVTAALIAIAITVLDFRTGCIFCTAKGERLA